MDTLDESYAKFLRDSAESSDFPYGTKASDQFEILKEYIDDFQNSLDSEHEVGMYLSCFGQNILLNVTHVEYEDPVLIIFEGYVNGKEATLIQHVNQLNFLLVSVTKEIPGPKRRVGFSYLDDQEE